MTALAGVFAVFVAILFYRLVERRHKIVLAKIVGAVAVLALVGTLLLYWQSARESQAYEAKARRLRATVTVVHEAHDSSHMSFTVCNHHTAALNQVQFVASGFVSGRSTPHAIDSAAYASQSETVYTSDIIVAPSQCAPISWRRSSGTVYDSVSVDLRGAKFADGTSFGYIIQ